jgi:hypothetical protein
MIGEAKSEIVRLQEDLWMGLLSWPALRCINVVQMRKLQLKAEVDASAIYAVPRNGKAGCGVLVEMPTIIVEHPASPGPQELLMVTCAVIEEPNLNLEPSSGTLMDAESVGRLVKKFMHGWFIRQKGELYAQRSAMTPTEDFPGLVAYRVGGAIQLAEDIWPRLTAASVASPAPFTVELQPAEDADDEVKIYFTTDGSLPGSENPEAKLYEGAITAAGNSVVRWCCWTEGNCLPSAVEEAWVDADGTVRHPTLGTT